MQRNIAPGSCQEMSFVGAKHSMTDGRSISTLQANASPLQIYHREIHSCAAVNPQAMEPEHPRHAFGSFSPHCGTDVLVCKTYVDEHRFAGDQCLHYSAPQRRKPDLAENLLAGSPAPRPGNVFGRILQQNILINSILGKYRDKILAVSLGTCQEFCVKDCSIRPAGASQHENPRGDFAE